MAHRDHHHHIPRSGWKPNKPKKVPQRGLGVAQLEKIRLEEQRKKEEALQQAAAAANNVHFPNSPVPPHAGGDPALEFIPFPHHQSGAVWSDESSLTGGKQRADHPAFLFLPQMNSNALHPIFYQFPRPPPSMASAPSGVPPLSVAALSPHIEPPSNQNRLCGNSYAPSLPEEPKMVGMKRPYPISVDSLPSPSFAGSAAATTLSRSDELLPQFSCVHSTPQNEPRNKHIRSGSSLISTGPLPEQKPNDLMRDNGKLNVDFLTLAPPLAAFRESNSDSDFRSKNNNPDSNHSWGCLSSKQPLSLFPVEPQTGKTASDCLASDVRNAGPGDGVKGESIDLNLKL